MAEIHLISLSHGGGPDIPMEIWARLIDKAWPGGGTVKQLQLSVGRDTVTIWPADSHQLEELASKLLTLAALQKTQEAQR